MTFLVLTTHGDRTCRLRVHEEGDEVPADAVVWEADAARIDRTLKRFHKQWVFGSAYENGAVFGGTQGIFAVSLASMLGPPMADKPKDKALVWVIALLGITGFIFAVLWLWMKTLMLIALIPLILLVFGRIIR